MANSDAKPSAINKELIEFLQTITRTTNVADQPDSGTDTDANALFEYDDLSKPLSEKLISFCGNGSLVPEILKLEQKCVT